VLELDRLIQDKTIKLVIILKNN